MKNFVFIAIVMSACLAACSSNEDARSCTKKSDCEVGEICQDGVCVDEPECSSDKPCADDSKRCVDGKCVSKPRPEEKKEDGEPCTEHDECLSAYCNADGVCAKAPQCSDTRPCSGDKMCKDGVCIDKNSNGSSCESHEVCKSGYCSEQGTCAEKPECSDESPCADASKMCRDGKCVEKNSNGSSCGSHEVCKSGYCSEQGTCAEKPECSDENPCADASKICQDGKCVDKPECSDENPCADASKICQDGKCVDKPECDILTPCADPKKTCRNGKCVEKTEECVSDSECGSGRICDNKHCVAEDSCSITRTCADKKICRDGKCIDMPHTACDANTPCAGDGMTCVAGKCVACKCGESEVCQADGSCVERDVSVTKGIKAGDVCTWSADFAFCEGNRYFTCTKAQGAENFTVGVRDCGAEICAQSPTDGWNCYEPCPVEGDIYGACWDDYNAAEQIHTALSFKTQCTKTDQGLIWTFTEGYEVCKGACVDGSCVNVPDAYGQVCYNSSFESFCQGDWNLFCTANGNSLGFVAGEDCVNGYAKDSEKFYCAYNSDRAPECVTACSEEGKTQSFCHDNGYGSTMSDKRTCRKGADGKLAFFLDSYSICKKGCDAKTGECL